MEASDCMIGSGTFPAVVTVKFFQVDWLNSEHCSTIRPDCMMFVGVSEAYVVNKYIVF